MKPRIVIQFAVTAKEKRQIQKAAKSVGMTVSHFLRLAAHRELIQVSPLSFSHEDAGTPHSQAVTAPSRAWR